MEALLSHWPNIIMAIFFIAYMSRDTTNNKKAIEELRADTRENQKSIFDLRLEMKDLKSDFDIRMTKMDHKIDKILDQKGV